MSKGLSCVQFPEEENQTSCARFPHQAFDSVPCTSLWRCIQSSSINPICVAHLQIGTKLDGMDNNTQNHSAIWKSPADEFFQ
jgi:hypothetical protein